MNMFPVQAEWRSLDWENTSKIIFHGINKSGSLCLADVIREGYFHAGRGHEVFSHYHGMPAKLEDLKRIIETSDGSFFCVAHYLFGSINDDLSDRIFVTQLRHPLPRIVSCFQWLKNRHVKENGDDEGFPSLEEFVKRGKGKSHSQITQFGCGFGEDRKQRYNAHPEEILERSKKMIEQKVAFIGISEYLEETIFALASICGLPEVPAWQQDKRNTGRILVSELPEGIINLIRNEYCWDFELYEWALLRFLNQLESIKFGPSLERYKDACQEEYKDRLLT